MWSDIPHKNEKKSDAQSQHKVADHLNSLDLFQRLTSQYVQALDDALQKEISNTNDASFAASETMSLLDRAHLDVEHLTDEQNKEELKRCQKKIRNILQQPSPGTQATWFLGPGGENLDALAQLSTKAMEWHKEFRKNPVKVPYNDKSDGYADWVAENQANDDYQAGIELLEERLKFLVCVLNNGSVPFHSFSYLSHMLWDNTMPGVLGWIVGVLYNQNNVAAEASPLTTAMEIDVSRQLCRMIGYPNTLPEIVFKKSEELHGKPDWRAIPWGKITCDGSVANIESIWMARNFRFFCLSLHTAFIEEPVLTNVRNHKHAKLLATGKREPKPFADLNTWEVINLVPGEFFNFLDRVARLIAPSMHSDIITGHIAIHEMVEKYDFRTLGMVDFARRYPVISDLPKVVAPGTRHYSWPKGVTLLGLGSNQLIDIECDKYGRLNLDKFEELVKQYAADRTPLLLTVSVHGSTTEGAIDPLAGILDIREKYRAKGFDFLVHVDAAWGGYFQALMVEPSEDGRTHERAANASNISEQRNAEQDSPLKRNSDLCNPGRRGRVSGIKPSLIPDFDSLKEADSLTLDPHKSGFIPYPAGGLLVRDSRLRERIAVRAPIVYKGESDPTVSWYGIEGSRAGAAVVSTWFSHWMVPLDKNGYGEVLGRCLFNAKLFYASLYHMAKASRNTNEPQGAYFVTTVPALSENIDRRVADRYIETIATSNPDDINALLNHPDPDSLSSADKAFREFLEEFGPDSAIVAYAFTPAQFIAGEFVPVTDVEFSNLLNNRLFDEYSMLKFDETEDHPDLFLSSTNYSEDVHGESFVNGLKMEMGVEGDGPIAFLVTTSMNPWLIDTPPMEPVSEHSPFPKGSMIGYLLGILDGGIKEQIQAISDGKSKSEHQDHQSHKGHGNREGHHSSLKF